MSQPGSSSRKPYWIVFGILTLLTVLEVGVAHPSLGLSYFSKVSALILLALAKAGLVAWVFMHLNHERPALKWTVALPFPFPALYAFVLIAEAGWRLLG